MNKSSHGWCVGNDQLDANYNSKVYTCGPMGAGKGYALSWMSKHSFFPLEDIVHIDPDHFKVSCSQHRVAKFIYCAGIDARVGRICR